MDVKCKYCGKEFHIRKSIYEKSKTKIFYCCKEHMNKDRNIGKTKVICDTCGKEIYKKNSQIFKKNFCNRECQKAYKKMKTIICKNCNKEFQVAKSYYNKQTKRGQEPIYCSKECMNDYKSKDMIITKCKVCNKEFRISKNKIKENGNCCSQECRIKDMQSTNVICKCDYCNNEIIKTKYSYEHSNKHFCNIDCFNKYREVKKDKYKNIAHFLRTNKLYEEWRKNILKRDKYKCVKCGSNNNIHAHHKIHLYDICEKYEMNIESILKSKEFNDLDNGITLCQECHALEHPWIQRDEKGKFLCRSRIKPQKS